MYAKNGLERYENIFTKSGLSFKGAIDEERTFKERRIKPRKNNGFPIILEFLPPYWRRYPIIKSRQASIPPSIRVNCAVIVVPILLPNMTPRLLSNEMTPVLTNAIAMDIIAVLDCIKAVPIAPTIVAEHLFLTSLDIFFRKFSVANSCISLVRLSTAKRNRTRIETIVNPYCMYST